MRITRHSTCHHDWRELRSVKKGAAVKFRHTFHQSLSEDDVFIVIDASAYPARNDAASYKIAVVNLSSGRLSYVDGSRDVRFVDAEVCVDD